MSDVVLDSHLDAQESPLQDHHTLSRRRQVGKRSRNNFRGREGRGRGTRKLTSNRRRGRGGGVTNYSLNERVLALWQKEQKFYKATISSIHWDGTYGVVFDAEKDTEYVNQQDENIQPIRNYVYHEEQKVKALFVKENKWYDATILGSDPNGTSRYKIKFEHLKNEFLQRPDLIRPCLEAGDRVMAVWFKDQRYIPATIEEDEKHCYAIRFDGRKNSFSGQRPDTLYALEDFEQDDEVLALWGQDGFFYPAVITTVEEVEDEEGEMSLSYKIKFHGLDKEFGARAHNLKKRFPDH